MKRLLFSVALVLGTAGLAQAAPTPFAPTTNDIAKATSITVPDRDAAVAMDDVILKPLASITGLADTMRHTLSSFVPVIAEPTGEGATGPIMKK